MSSFDQAIPIILKLEGGYNNDPDDPGGETNWGISKRAYPNIDIKSLTREQAIYFYRRDWWAKYNYGAINDQQVATKVFDMAVNMGAGQAHKLLQRACNECYGGEILKVDGVFGNKTLTIVNLLMPAHLLAELREQTANFYRNLVEQKPQLDKFLNGWLKRASE